MNNALVELLQQSFPVQELLYFCGTAFVAVICGIIIGLERESKGKPAGLRTLVLISLGSALYVRVSLILSSDHGDPARVAAQIVSGIGFLGAGAILQNSEQGFIAGLTTAASIWVTAAVGMIVGSGHFVMGIAAVTIVVVVLRLLTGVEGFLFYGDRVELKKVHFQSDAGKTKWAIMGLLEDNMIRLDEYSFHAVHSERPFLEFRYAHKNRNHRAFLTDLACLPQVSEMT
jgi:putative Mg2+ transporter-C (MgtC) family protein